METTAIETNAGVASNVVQITGNGSAEATGNWTNAGNTLSSVQNNADEIGVNYASNGNAKGENNITVDTQASGSVVYANGNKDGTVYYNVNL